MIGWFRSHHGAPTDPKWIVIAAKAGSRPGVVAAVWWALMDHASQAHPRGSVATFDQEALSAFYGFPEAEIASVVKVLQDKQLIGANGRLKNWSKRQPKRERDDPKAAERAKAWRERQQTPDERTRTPPNANERPEESREEEITTTPPLGPPSAPPGGGGAKKRGRASGDPLPAAWHPNATHERIAAEERVDLAREAAKFRDDAASKGWRRLDWDAAFRNWLRRAREFSGQNGNHPAAPDSDWAGRLKIGDRG